MPVLQHYWSLILDFQDAKSLANCSLIAKIADRSYLYDNSVEGEQARLIFRVANGMLVKPYVPINPWAQEIAGLLRTTSN